MAETRPLSGTRLRFLTAGGLFGFGCFALATLIAFIFWFLLMWDLKGTPVPVAEGLSAAVDEKAVVLVLVDDLRRDHLSAYGSSTQPAPTIATLAGRGVAAADYLPSSTATTPSVASVLTGLAPDEHGLTSARAFGAHRLASTNTTLAEFARDAGWRTLGGFALPWAHPRLSGLGQGLAEVVGPAPGEAAWSDARLVAEAADRLPDTGGEPLFLCLHLAGLREDAELDPAEVAPWLAEHVPAFAGEDAELTSALADLASDPGGAVRAVERLLARKRSSEAWLALQEARYDARLARLDRALSDLMGELRKASRATPVVVVAGTRGRLLGAEPPEDGPPVELCEALLATALIADGPGVGPEWASIDRPAALHDALRRLLGVPTDDRARAPVRRVVGPALGAFADVVTDRKDVVRGDGGVRTFQRPSDRELVEDVPARLAERALDRGAWEFTLTGSPDADATLRLTSAAGDIATAIHAGQITEGDERSEVLVSPTGRSADAHLVGPSLLNVLPRTPGAAWTLRVSSAAGAPTLVGQAALTADSSPLVSDLLPVFPANREDAETEATLRLTREDGWTRVRAGDGEAQPFELVLWRVPASDSLAAVDLGDGAPVGGANPVTVQPFPGLDAVLVRGLGQIDLRVRRAAGQSLAVGLRLDGEVVPAAAMSSEDGPAVGESGAELTLFLPPVDLGAFAIRLGDATIEAARRYPGAPLEPPLDLTEDDLRLLRRLGPLE